MAYAVRGRCLPTVLNAARFLKSSLLPGLAHTELVPSWTTWRRRACFSGCALQVRFGVRALRAGSCLVRAPHRGALRGCRVTKEFQDHVGGFSKSTMKCGGACMTDPACC